MGTLHAGDIRTSRRLQDTAAILRTAGAVGITTLGISRATGSCAVHSDIAGLRANGFVIEKKRERDTERCCTVWRYWLVFDPRDEPKLIAPHQPSLFEGVA
mgnify:CR=1 FL=1